MGSEMCIRDRGFTKSMAIEWGPHGIRVNTICPTFVRTPLTEPTFSRPERVKWIKEKIKLGRVGEVEDTLWALCNSSHRMRQH